MHTQYIFFIVYIGLLFWLLPRIPFLSRTGLKAGELRLFLLIKLLAGLFCSFYFFEVVLATDYWVYHNEGLVEYKLLKEDPVLFFTDFQSDLQQYGLGGLLETSGSFWAYLKFHLLGKIVAILNLGTKGNFYLNSLIFSSITYFGHIAFYRIFSDIYSTRKKTVLLTCFLLPSVLLYTACIHKDGIIFLSLAFASLCFYQFIKGIGKTGVKQIAVFLISLFIIFLFRNYILMAMLPAMGIAYVVSRAGKHKLIKAAALYCILIIVFFATGLLRNSLNLPAAVVKRKADFALLEKGNTNLEMKQLEPTPQSFAKNLPQAVNHVMLRPYPTEGKAIGVLFAAFELYLYLLLLLYFVWRSLKDPSSLKNIHSFNIYGIIFFISMVFIIGLTIPNIGAIVRYRSILWIFLLPPLICRMADQFGYIAERKRTAHEV